MVYLKTSPSYPVMQLLQAISSRAWYHTLQFLCWGGGGGFPLAHAVMSVVLWIAPILYIRSLMTVTLATGCIKILGYFRGIIFFPGTHHMEKLPETSGLENNQ